MGYAKKKGAKIRWVSVPLDHVLHGAVREKSVRLHQSWPAVVDEAMRLWLVHHRRGNAA